MSESVTISSAPPATTSMNYAALREGGLVSIRRWAADSWNDHNVHDPGIAILEACSYAITELGLRLQLDVSDLVRSGESHGVAEFEPAHRVLPVAPVTRQDLRHALLDHPLVRDARTFLRADNEVPFYEVPGGNPPLTYTAGTARVRPQGLYEVLIELADRLLNTNTYAMQVVVGPQTYDIDLALPFWDDPEAAPFREGGTVTSVAMVPDGTEVWRALPEAHSYFGRIDVGYTDASAVAANIVMWVVLRITTVLTQPNTVLPGILAAARTEVESTAPTGPVMQFAQRVVSAVSSIEQLQTYLAGWRNLGEQAVRIGVARVQEIAIRARIEVTGGIDVETLLAGIFADLEEMLSPRVRFDSLADRRSDAPFPEHIFDGPLLRHGFLAADTLLGIHPQVLFLSDVLRLVMRRRSRTRADVVSQENPVGRDIVAVTDLALSNFINNRPITADAEDCLRLVETERYRPRLSIAKSRIVVVRDDAEVPYDAARVERLFDELVAAAEARSRTTETSPVWPVSPGERLPVEDYTPIQADLPSNCGVGEAVLPESAPLERHAAVKQLQGYLFLFEQFLADTTAQLGNINRFFSSGADEATTYFTRPLFDVPGVPKLLKKFPAGADWATFVQAPDNPFARALHDAAENRTQLLDRRNRMLDHLLARQGEDAVSLGQELHRWAQAELAPATLPVAQQPERIAERRDAANARLIRIKSALLQDAPELNALRLQAHGFPNSERVVVRMESTAAGFRWHAAVDGVDQLRSFSDTFATELAATFAAEHALAFAGRAALYRNDHVGGGFRRLRLMDGTTGGAPVAETPQTFPNVGAATTAATALAATFAGLRVLSSLAPLERRVAYLTGIRNHTRRRLLPPAAGHFEIVNDPPGGGLFGKRWRFRDVPATGQVVLNSPSRFDATTDAAAIALAEASIRQVVQLGMDEWNYVISPAAGNTFTYELKDRSGTTIAIRDAGLPSRTAAQTALAAAIDLLYRAYSAEGFYLIEHLLLRPRQTGQPFLSLPLGETARERDPYSHRLSFVFPSGFARDFSLGIGAPRTDVTPHRFRDPEFRRHAERVIRQACPAHLLPTIYWVDRAAAGTPAATASFDAWETRYFNWLDTALIPAAPAPTIAAARDALVQALNAIANDA